MSTDQFDELEDYEEIDISELLQIHLALQAELGVVSELFSDILRNGQMNKVEILRSLHSMGDLIIEAIDIIGEEEELFEQNSNNGASPPDIN